MKYEAVIGLEVHAELKTRTKMFCDSKNDPDEKHPNLNICPVCMGHPGTLPAPNREAIEKVIRVGLALHGTIPPFSQFDRKNYFYPDLPKGYQISQYEHPLVSGGWLEINPKDGGSKRIRIRRIHLEEDTGRLIHDIRNKASLVDFNRAGVPLMELVTEPDFRSSEEVRLFAEELRAILRFLDASEADMEKGEMRIEANVSLRPEGSDELGTKVELKNINSFSFVGEAVAHEIERQREMLSRGEKVTQETRGWDEKRAATVLQRSKEEAHDYRYFPEPDITPITISQDLVDRLDSALPELPQKKQARFVVEYGLAPERARAIAYEKDLSAFFEESASEISEWCETAAEAKMCRRADLIAMLFNYLTVNLQALISARGASIKEVLVTPENFAELVTYVALGRLSQSAAKEVLKFMFEAGGDPSVIASEKNLWQVSDEEEIGNIAEKTIYENPQAVADIKAGKEQALQFLVGRVMRASGGRANPEAAQAIVRKLISQ